MSNCWNHGWTDAERISTIGSFFYIDTKLGDEIRLKQEVKYNYVFAFLHSIILRVTEVVECTLAHMPCTCRILGDGQVHHYGVKYT